LFFFSVTFRVIYMLIVVTLELPKGSDQDS